MLKRTLSLLLFALVLATPSIAEERGAISGKVFDKKTGHALPFANVAIPAARLGGLTDSEGQYRITVPVGTYEVRVQFLGYRPEVKPGVAVTVGKTTQLNFELTDIVVTETKAIEVSAERRLVEVKQGATIRSTTAAEIRNLPVSTISDVLQQQAGVNIEGDQIHVRGGRADETIFVVNGVTNRDLVSGNSTAGKLSARSVAEVNVATGAYDVKYGNALSGVVDVRLKDGGEKFDGGLTISNGTFGGRSVQLVAGAPDPIFRPLLRRIGLNPAGTLTSIIDVSGSLFETRFRELDGKEFGFFDRFVSPSKFARLHSSYEDSFFGHKFTYGDFFSPSQDNDWSARYGLTWKPNNRNKVAFNFQKRISIDQGFSRTFVDAQGNSSEPAYPWKWAHRIDHAPTYLDDNVQGSAEWRRTLSATGYTQFQVSHAYYAQRRDVMGKQWGQLEAPDDFSLPPGDPRRSDYFYDTGDNNTWQDTRNSTWALEGSGVQRFLKRHEFELGFEHQFQSVQYLTIQDPWVFDPDGLGGSHDLWKVHPMIGDLYLRDRIEYEGFVGNVGLRADYWFAGREAEAAMADTSNGNITAGTRDQFYDETHSFFGRRYKMHLSPRVIVAHPITESSSFFFNYGQFTQNPSYRYVYSKLSSISSEAFPLQGNPNLNPKVSINYEVGAKNQFTRTSAINITFFVKDVYDYPSATTINRQQGASLVPVLLYLNGSFARAKGFEIEVQKRRSSYWAGKLTYTFQQTQGKDSDPNEQKIVLEGGGNANDTRLGQIFVSWNRPHQFYSNFDIRFDGEAPRYFGWAKHGGMNLTVQARSGKPYTPRALVNGASVQVGESNSKNVMVQFTTDLKLNRSFHFVGRRIDLSVQGTNIFNNYLIQRLDPLTGKGYEWGKGLFSREANPGFSKADFDYLRVSQFNDPSNYGPGAQWRLNFDYDF